MDNKPTGAESPAQTILDLEQMIKGYLSDMSRIREQLRSQREMHTSAFEQDASYNETNEEATKAKKKVAEIKQKLVKTDAIAAVTTKMKELKDEMKDAQHALSAYLNKYAELTNATRFTDDDGEIHEIVRTAKLVKKRA
jgi:predicted  nucleic acid-binding Zn-ribbon protein